MDTLELDWQRESTSNGHRLALGGRTDWRERALGAALRAEALDGRSEDALLGSIRREGSVGATMLACLDRPRLLEFMRTECETFRNMTNRSDRYDAGDENRGRPYVGWYAARWRGEEVEVAFPPDWGDPGYIIAMGSDEEWLDRFVRAA